MSCACTQDRIPLVNPGFSARVLRQEPRLVWSFWVAAGLAAAGGAMPFLVGGSSSRISNVYIPYAIGAVAFGAAALWHDRGRAVTGGLYFVAGLALGGGSSHASRAALHIRLLETHHGICARRQRRTGHNADSAAGPHL